MYVLSISSVSEVLMVHFIFNYIKTHRIHIILRNLLFLSTDMCSDPLHVLFHLLTFLAGHLCLIALLLVLCGHETTNWCECIFSFIPFWLRIPVYNHNFCIFLWFSWPDLCPRPTDAPIGAFSKLLQMSPALFSILCLTHHEWVRPR